MLRVSLARYFTEILMPDKIKKFAKFQDVLKKNYCGHKLKKNTKVEVINYY